jgi:AraC-like DNA-binding protein
MKKTFNTYSIHLSTKRTLPLYRSTRSLEAVARYLSRQGIKRASFLAGSGIEARDLDDPDFLVTPEQELLVLKNIVKLRPDPGLGLSVGREFHLGILGKLGAAALNSDTLLDAHKIIYQYSELLQTYYHYDLLAKDDRVYIKLNELVDLKDLRLFMCERELASVFRIGGDLIGDHPYWSEVRFTYPKPTHVAHYQDFFQCPLLFNAKDIMFIFDKKYLFKPLPLANPLLRKIYEKDCQQLSLRMKKQETITKRIQQEIIFHKNGLPSFDQMSHYFNLSTRTLRRRLSAEGTSYKDLASQIQKNKAINLLRTTDYPIWQISAELGYNDLANFYRAFKSWTGYTPNS